MQKYRDGFYPPDENNISHIIINGQDLTDKIRSKEVDNNVSTIAKNKEIREIMTRIQRKIAKSGKIILDGRDIGSRVLPDAEYKFLLPLPGRKGQEEMGRI